MPVTIKIAEHDASLSRIGSQPIQSPEKLLQGSCPAEYQECHNIFQSSFDRNSDKSIHSSSNGFVRAAVEAYSYHQYLVIRPEDVWFAILTQLSVYINKHPEELREKFVAHTGKVDLEVVRVGNRHTVDHNSMIEETTQLMEKKIVDPELRRWILPSFTTTSRTDEVVASILMMGALQKYFSYSFRCCCGIPSVTLLGEKSDWEDILTRLEKLKTFGDEPTYWYHLLKPVVSRFVMTFDNPASPELNHFWTRIVHRRGGSGVDEISGWLTAFCLWNEDGRMLYNLNVHPSTLTPLPSWAGRQRAEDQALSLDGQTYGRFDMEDLPRGYASVPVKYNDNGYKFDAVILAGSVGIKRGSSGKVTAEGQVGVDTLQAVSGWWMYEKKGDPSSQTRDEVSGRKGDIPRKSLSGKLFKR